MSKVFLGGTCNNSLWRERLITMLNVDYFNPVVENWTEESKKNEENEKILCDIHLYVITPLIQGTFSIAEAVNDSVRIPKQTILCVLQSDDSITPELPATFNESLKRSMFAVEKLVESNGAFVVHSLKEVADLINETTTKGVALYSILSNGIVKIQTEKTVDSISDGFHTFKELYEYRKLYNAAFFNEYAKYGSVIKSKRHNTGEECFGGGWFIVMAKLPTGQISNHYELKDWDLFKCKEVEKAWKWDGHTPQDVAKRLEDYLKN